MEQDTAEALVRRAMAQASIAAARGDAPFGAMLAAPDGTVLLEAANAQATGGDPTAHAEIALIRGAARLAARPHDSRSHSARYHAIRSSSGSMP